MHAAFRAGKTYPAEWKSGCKNCSFYDICIPETFSRKKTVRDFINESLKSEIELNGEEINKPSFSESQI